MRISGLFSFVFMLFALNLATTSPASARAESIDPREWGLPLDDEKVTIYCQNVKIRDHPRRAVWINAKSGTYSVNGTAQDWAMKYNWAAPLKGNDGGLWKPAWDYFPRASVKKLMKFGLKICD